MGPMQCPSFEYEYLKKVATDFVVLLGMLKQEHGLRLLLCVRVSTHGFGFHRIRHDFHDRAWDRHCKFCVPVVDVDVMRSPIERKTTYGLHRFVMRLRK